MQLFRNPRDGCGAQFERQADFILEWPKPVTSTKK
jgi:hypothetical protein